MSVPQHTSEGISLSLQRFMQALKTHDTRFGVLLIFSFPYGCKISFYSKLLTSNNISLLPAMRVGRLWQHMHRFGEQWKCLSFSNYKTLSSYTLYKNIVTVEYFWSIFSHFKQTICHYYQRWVILLNTKHFVIPRYRDMDRRTKKCFYYKMQLLAFWVSYQRSNILKLVKR